MSSMAFNIFYIFVLVISGFSLYKGEWLKQESSLSKVSVTSSYSSEVDNLHYVGCFDPGFSLRQNYHHHIVGVTLGKCVQFCQTLRTKFAGVEASDNFCYCGPDIAEESIQRDNNLCNVPCTDVPLRNCGGDWLFSLYEIMEAKSGNISENVDFLLGISTGVRLYHSADESTFDTLLSTSDWVYSVDYHFSRNLLFVYSKRKIFKASLQPTVSASTGQLVRSVSQCEGFAVDWVHDRIYLADCDRNGTSIMSMGLEGEEEVTVISTMDLVGKFIKRMAIDPYKGKIFWTADGVIQSCDTSGEKFATNVSKADVAVRALTLDLKQRRVYYIGNLNQSTSLYSMDYTGREEIEHFSIPQFRSVYGLSILGDNLFWVNYANVRDVIYKAPLNLTTTEDVKMLKTIDRAVWHMRVVHPSLQKRPKIDPCLDKECTHGCIVQDVSSAKCDCPPDLALYQDGVSCQKLVGQHQSPVTATVIFVCIVVVIGMLLMAVGLVIVVDNYRNRLNSMLFRIPYTRSQGRVDDTEGDFGTTSSEYHTGSDNVNLI